MANPFFEPYTHSPAEPCDCTSCGAGPKLPVRVHLFSGEFFESAEDLRIPGRGLDFVWARKYRSRAERETAQGNRWDFSYNLRFEVLPDKLTLFNGDGREDIFLRQLDGTFVRDEFFLVGRQNPDGTFTFRFPDNGVWNFLAHDGRPEQGKISSIVDRNANRLAFRYDPNGRLTEIIDTLGRQIHVTYNAEGFIASITDFLGRRVSYAYYVEGDAGGSFGDLQSVTRPAVVGTPNSNDFPNGKTVTYTYSKGFADKRRNHNLLTITDPKGQTYLKNTYSQTKDPQNFDFSRLRRHVLGGDNDITDIVYVPQIPTAENNQAIIMAIANNSGRHVKEYLYDAKNRCVLVREYTGRSPKKAPTTVTNNRPTQPLRDTDPKFFEARYEWNKDSLLKRIVDPGGNITERDYEEDSNPKAESRFRGNLRAVRILPGPLAGDQTSLLQLFEYHPGFGCSCASDFVSKAIDPRGNTTLKHYDDRGNLLRVRHRIASIVEEFKYNEFGQRTRYTHPDNGSGHRRVDAYTYYTKADGAQNGYLKEEIIDAENLALTTTYEYDAAGNVTRVIDPGGHDFLYVWNSLDQIVRELSSGVNDHGDRCQVDIFYDANDNRTRTDVQNKNEQGVVQPNAHVTTTRGYDILNHCVRISKEVSPNRGVVKAFSYDGNHNRTLVRYGEATNGNQPGNSVRLVYDERGLLFQKVRAPGTKLQSTIQYDYDPVRNRVRVAIGLEDTPREYRNAYDGYGRVVRTTDPAGSVITYRYDPNGNVVSHQMTGRFKQAAAATPNTLRLFQAAHRFDEMDRRVSSEIAYFDTETQAPIGKGASVSRTEYSDNSDALRTIDDNGHETRTVYDTANRKRDIIDHKGNTVSYAYDRGTNIVEIREVEKSDTGEPDRRSITGLSYDNLDRLIQVSDNLGKIHQYAYDSRGNRTLSRDALGNTVRLEYDGLDRLISVSRFLTDNGMGAGHPTGVIVTTQMWDDNSRLTSRVDPNGNVTRYAYDELNRETAETFADGSIRSHIYDIHGNRLTTKDPNGTIATASYDLLNRLIRRSIVPGPGVSKAVTRETYDYDPLSRLVGAQNDHSVLTRRYDSLSHITREEVNGRVLSSVYDGAGNQLRCTYPSGREITAEYDELNRKRSIADERGTIAVYRYIGASRIDQREIQGPLQGVSTRFAYDDVKRLVAITHFPGAGGSTLDDQEFGWDPVHNKTHRSDLRGGKPFLSWNFRYDSAYRLRQALVTDGAGKQIRETGYVLDSAGNRVRVTGGNGEGAYTRSAALPEQADARVNQYTRTPFDNRRYDKNGNLLFVSQPGGGTQQMTYDYRDRMVEYRNDATGRALSFAYDPLGRRIAKTILSDKPRITNYVYDRFQIIEEQDKEGKTQATYVYGTHLNDIVNMRRGDNDIYYHADDLGSVIAVTDSAGKLAERYEYQDFGEPAIFGPEGKRLQESALNNPYLFTGQRFDSETGLYHYHTRYLDSKTGRFTTRDTRGIWEDAGNLGNGYTYAHNNPLTFVDPNGESTYRTIACGGPWPGPSQMVIEYEGCSKSRRQGLDVPICRAFRASGQAQRDIISLWSFDLTGISLPGINVETTRQRVKKWFGGPDNATSSYSKSVIATSLDDVFDAFKEFDVDIDCESGCDSGVNAYVVWGGYDVNLCSNFFNSGFSNSKKAAILVHELTHAYADTDDFGAYYQTDGNNSPWGQLFETPTLREHADSYEQFVLEFYT